MSWDERDDLACRQPGIDPDLFFPGPGGPTGDAKAVCGRCPAMMRCREWALQQPVHQLYGVWGGTSQQDREAMVRANRWVHVDAARREGEIAPCGTLDAYRRHVAHSCEPCPACWAAYLRSAA